MYVHKIRLDLWDRRPRDFFARSCFLPANISYHMYSNPARIRYFLRKITIARKPFFFLSFYSFSQTTSSLCALFVFRSHARALLFLGFFSAINFRGLSRFGFLHAQIFFLLPLIYIYRFVIYNRAISLGKKIYKYSKIDNLPYTYYYVFTQSFRL